MDEKIYERADHVVTQDLPQSSSSGTDASGDKKVVTHSTLTRSDGPEYSPNQRNTFGDQCSTPADAPTPVRTDTPEGENDYPGVG